MGTILGTVKITVAFRLSTEKVVLCVWCVQLRCICWRIWTVRKGGIPYIKIKKKSKFNFQIK